MQKFFFVFATVLFLSCGSKDSDKKTSENEVDAARNFLRASLDGKWKEAKEYMLKDSLNEQTLSAIDDNYQQHLSSEVKRGFREAEIITYDPRKVSDSVTIINYSNTYMNKKDSLKLVRINGQWLVDLKYTFPASSSAR